MKLSRGVCAILLLLIIPSVNAMIGVSPVSYSVDFSPGLEQDFNFYFMADPDMDIKIVAEGDLAEYVELSRGSMTGPGTVNVKIELPQSIDVPGVHTIFIAGQQQIDEDQQGIVLRGIVKAKIFVKVPYPGKYAAISFKSENANTGQPINLSFEIQNLGSESITATPTITIYDFSNKSVETFRLDSIDLESPGSESETYVLNTEGYLPGFYRAELSVEYGGEEPAVASSSFRLGELKVEIINTTSRFVKDKINRFDINVESFWNDPLDGVYAEVDILDYGIKFQTPSTTLSGFQKSVLTGYFDTTGIIEDNFKAKVTLHYSGQANEKIVNLKFKNETNYLMYGLVAGILVLILVVVVLVVWMRRMSDKPKRRK